jgi:hypothetical protein
MNASQHNGIDAAPGGAALLSLRHVPLTTRLAAGALYGVTAGALLHDNASVAGAVMVAVWIATVWSPRFSRRP